MNHQSNNQCLIVEPLLTAYLLGDLPAETTAQVKAHLALCGACRAEFRELEATLGFLRDAIAPVPGIAELHSASVLAAHGSPEPQLGQVGDARLKLGTTNGEPVLDAAHLDAIRRSVREAAAGASAPSAVSGKSAKHPRAANRFFTFWEKMDHAPQFRKHPIKAKKPGNSPILAIAATLALIGLFALLVLPSVTMVKRCSVKTKVASQRAARELTALQAQSMDFAKSAPAGPASGAVELKPWAMQTKELGLREEAQPKLQAAWSDAVVPPGDRADISEARAASTVTIAGAVGGTIADFNDDMPAAAIADGADANSVLDMKMSKSPIRITGIYGGRGNAGRRAALGKYGRGSTSGGESADVRGETQKREAAEAEKQHEAAEKLAPQVHGVASSVTGKSILSEEGGGVASPLVTGDKRLSRMDQDTEHAAKSVNIERARHSTDGYVSGGNSPAKPATPAAEPVEDVPPPPAEAVASLTLASDAPTPVATAPEQRTGWFGKLKRLVTTTSQRGAVVGADAGRVASPSATPSPSLPFAANGGLTGATAGALLGDVLDKPVKDYAQTPIISTSSYASYVPAAATAPTSEITKSDSGTLALNGGGTLGLSADNSYSDQTTVSGGILAVSGKPEGTRGSPEFRYGKDENGRAAGIEQQPLDKLLAAAADADGRKMAEKSRRLGEVGWKWAEPAASAGEKAMNGDDGKAKDAMLTVKEEGRKPMLADKPAEDVAVMLADNQTQCDDMETRFYTVPPDAVKKIVAGTAHEKPDEQNGHADPDKLKNTFAQYGVQFGTSSAISYNQDLGKLIVRNVPEELLKMKYVLANIYGLAPGSTDAPDITDTPEIIARKKADEAQAKLRARLHKIIIPKIEFEDATIAQAVAYLKKRSQQLDPEGKGVNIVLPGMEPGADPNTSIAARTLTISMNNVALDEAIHYICMSAGIKFKLDSVVATDDAPPPAPKAEPLDLSGINPFVDTARENFSTFGIDVDTAAYTLARNAFREGRMPEPNKVRVEEFVNAFDYDYAPPPAGRAFAIYADSAPSPFRPRHELLKIGVKGYQLARNAKAGAVLTFAIDGSGSMNTEDRLGLVRSSLKLLLGQLRPDDRVAIVQFNDKARLVLEPTPVSETKKIQAAIDAIQAAGPTNLEGGLRTAYETAARAFTAGAANRVLLLSDGVANLGAAGADDILKTIEVQRKQGIYLSVYGVGSGAYNDKMLQQLADKGDGTYQFLDSAAEAKRVFVDQLAANLFTIAKDVKIQVEFNQARVAQYRQLGYEKRKLTKEQFRDDTVDAGEVGAGQAATALYELVLRGTASEPVGVVRVRYKNIATGVVEEIQQTVTISDRSADSAQAPVRFRLAAGVAEFAELLRGSPHVQGSSYTDVAKVLRPVVLELRLNGQVQELGRLVHQAEGLGK